MRNERYYKIPFCKKDCDQWFNDCKNRVETIGAMGLFGEEVRGFFNLSYINAE